MKKYTKEEINTMKEALAEAEFDVLDLGDLKQILWDGCVGWDKMNDKDVIDYYKQLMED